MNISWQDITNGIFLFSCALLALLVASFCKQLIWYATGKTDDAFRAAAKKKVLRLSAFMVLFMFAWWLIPLCARLVYSLFV